MNKNDSETIHDIIIDLRKSLCDPFYHNKQGDQLIAVSIGRLYKLITLTIKTKR